MYSLIKRVAVGAAVSLLLAAALVCTASAENAGVAANQAVTLDNVEAGLLTANLTELIDQFNSADAWNAVDGTTTVNAVETLSEMPYSPLLGDRCLEVTAPAGQTSASVRREYAYPLNFSDAKWLCFCVCLPDEEGRSFTAAVEITWFDGTTYSASAQVSGDTWNAVLCELGDVSSRAGGGLVSAIKLTLTASDKKGFTAHFDGLGTSSSESFLSSMTCMTDGWYTSGGVLSYEDDGSLTFEVSDTDPFIESTSLRYNSFSTADALRLRLINGAGCKSVTLYYTTYTSPDFSGERSRTVEIAAASSAQTVYLPILSDYVGQIRIVFNGELRGDIKILSLTPVSTYVSYDSGYASITSCKITASDTIKLEGTLTDTSSDRLRGYVLELYELSIWQEADAATLATLEPVDSTPAMQSFAFELPLYTDNGNSRINSKFAVVIWRDEVPVLIDGYKYITNPELIAPLETAYERATLIKGASPAESAGDLLESGTAQTVIEVSLPELMTLTGSGVTFTSNGVVYAASTDCVERLDEQIRRYTESGIRVYLRLTTSYTGSASENRVFNHPDSVSTASYAAFNTESATGVAYLRAACEFLSARYSAGTFVNGRVYGYIIGCSVDAAYKYYNLGQASLADFIAAYGAAVRVAYNAVRSAAGAGPEVYISLSSAWDQNIAAGSRFIYDSRSVLDALDAMYGEEGDIGWQLSFDPYPDEAGYLAYADKNAGTDYTADRITFANLDLLCSYLMRQQLYYAGTYRPILLCERPKSVAQVYSDTAAATDDYIYASYKLSSVNYSLITGFIITHADSIDADVYRLIDTQYTAEISSPYKQTLGITEWRELIPAFDESTAVKRYLYETTINSTAEAGNKGTYTLWSFDSDASGWVSTLGCDTLSGGNSFDGREGLLRMKLSPQGSSQSGVYTVFGYKYDLSVAPVISFELGLAALPDGVDKAELTLVLTDGTNTAYAKGTVVSGGWNTIYADFSGFTGIRSCSRLMIMLRGEQTQSEETVQYTNIGEPVVMIGQISANSAQYTNDELVKLFDAARDAALSQNTRRVDTGLMWITFVIILTAISLWTIYIMARIRSRSR